MASQQDEEAVMRIELAKQPDSGSYGATKGIAVNTDPTDIKSYFKHKRKFQYKKITEEIWKQKILIVVVLLLEISLLLIGLLNENWKAMPWEAWFSIEVTVVTLALLIANYFPPAFVFLAAMSTCYVVGIIDSTEALEGFSNSGVITVGVLFIIAKAIELSDVLRYMVKYVLRNPKYLVWAQLRLLIPVGFLSAFINNTPIVAMMIPVVQNWSRQCGLKVTKLLMPMSYAAILGGTCTIIGTSTNLIVQGLAETEDPNMELGFFEIGKVGVPVAAISLIYMLIFSNFLLPNQDPDDIEARPTLVEGSEDKKPNQRRFYSVSLTLTKGSGMIGKSVEESGLTKLPGLNIYKLMRVDEIVEEVDIDEGGSETDIDSGTLLYAGDTLFFSGMLRHMYILYQLDGLVPATTQVAKIEGARADRVIIEIVIGNHSDLLGKTVRRSNFRKRYNAVIIAVQRYGVRLSKKIGDITLKAGDTLLLEATTDFLKYHRGSSDFALVSEILRGESTTPRRISFTMIFVVGLATVMVLLSAFQVLDLLPGALIVACLYVLFRAVTWNQAMSSIQGDTLLIIAAAFGLGNALQVSTAAEVISNTLVTVFSVGGDIGVLFGLYASTALLSAVISNAATVTLMYPIAVGFSVSAGISLRCVTYVLMLAASCSFSTPVGYQTNLMVMGPGGYTTLDFLKFGVPLTVLDMIISVLLSYWIWGDDFQASRENMYDTPVGM